MRDPWFGGDPSVLTPEEVKNKTTGDAGVRGRRRRVHSLVVDDPRVGWLVR